MFRHRWQFLVLRSMRFFQVWRFVTCLVSFRGGMLGGMSVVVPGHEGHPVFPHDHSWQGRELFRCSGRWWCEDCRVWVDGPKCLVR